MQTQINLGEIIKEGMYQKRISQASLAREMNKNKGVINSWCKNRRKPDADSLIRLFALLDLVSLLFPEYSKGNKQNNN